VSIAIIDNPRDSIAVIALIIANTIFFALIGSLLLILIGHHWELPKTQKSIILPLLGSATCAALLFGGAAMASQEFFFGGESRRDLADTVANILLISTGVVWVGWIVLFACVSRSVNRLTLSDRLYQSLLAGSLLELLVAIPMHLVVRRRSYCCAGENTGMAIGVGIVVMIIALGPAVFFLFFRRYKQAYPGREQRAKRKAVQDRGRNPSPKRRSADEFPD
jgi:hypothetical protein